MSNDNIQKLLMLCHRMQQEGVAPSVGMLRSKAPFKVSVTEAIETVKRFNESSVHKRGEQVIASSKEKPLSERVAHLENEVEALKCSLESVLKKLAE